MILNIMNQPIKVVYYKLVKNIIDASNLTKVIFDVVI